MFPLAQCVVAVKARDLETVLLDEVHNIFGTTVFKDYSLNLAQLFFQASERALLCPFKIHLDQADRGVICQMLTKGNRLDL